MLVSSKVAIFALVIALSKAFSISSADLSKEELEFVKNMTGDKLGSILSNDMITIPISVDWRQLGAVTPVKMQRTCSSWTFSATGDKGQMFKKTGKLVSLSEQNLLDCVSKSSKCSSEKSVATAFDYVTSNGGIDTEASYAYESTVGNCRYKPEERGGYANGSQKVVQSDVLLRLAVATVGPISVVLANDTTFSVYHGGIYYRANCSQDTRSRAVLLVGYGIELLTGVPYWLIKNSWGPMWGEEGYMRLSAVEENMCGIASRAYYPIVL